MPRTRLAAFLLCASVAVGGATFGAVLGACGPSSPGEDGGTGDAGNGMMLETCERDEDCADDLECTTESCNSAGYCQYLLDDGMCSDGVFCNGIEQCRRNVGCMAADGDPCNDRSTCTIDSCDEEASSCTNLPRDLDLDGDPDSHCKGGGDCDDRDPLRSSLRAEVCDNGRDDDCDDLADEPACSAAPYDTCETALDVSAGGEFEVELAGMARDYDASCALAGAADFAFTFTLSEAKDVDITAAGLSTTTVALFAACGEGESEFECRRAVGGGVRSRALPAGTYAGIVVAPESDSVMLSVAFGDPTEPPSNESCASPASIGPLAGPGAVQTVEGSLVDTDGDHALGCLAGETRDLVYTVTTQAAANLVVSAQASSGDSLAVSIRSDCDAAESEQRCVRGGPAQTRLYSVPAGTYYVVVAVTAAAEPDVELTVELEPPTAPPAGDSCDAPVPLTLGQGSAMGLVGAEDDHDTGCGVAYRDLVFSFVLAEQSDVFVDIDAGQGFVYAAVQDTCGSVPSERLCVADTDPSFRVRNLPPGDYFLVLEAFSTPNVTVTVSRTDPTVPEVVAGNTTCGTATVVGDGGGLYSGTTAGAGNDLDTQICLDASGPDAVFRIELDAATSLLASTEGSAFDTVLSLRETSCEDVAETACDDSSGAGDTSTISATVGPGTVYLVVDGFGGDSGDYILDVVLGP